MTFVQRSRLIEDAESFAATFAGSSQLAVGTNLNEVRLYTASAGGWKASNTSLSAAASSGKAVTSLVMAVQLDPIRNFALVGCSDGNVSLWHVGSRQLLHALSERAVDDNGVPTDIPNEVYALKVSIAGVFATGGKDGVVRIYDEERQTLTSLLMSGVEDGQLRAHSAKVNALCWADPNTLLSGGWDRTVQVWDLRQARSVSSIFGAYLCGQGLDVHPDGTSFVTASTREQEQLQTWELRTGKKLCDVAWPTKANRNADDVSVPPTLLAASYSPDGKWLAAGGSRDFRIFDATTLTRASPTVVGDIAENPFAVFNLAWSASSTELVVAGTKTVVLGKVH